MQRSWLLLAIASVFAGTTALLVALGAVFNPILIMFAVPFALAAYFLWSHATGRLGTPIRITMTDATFRTLFQDQSRNSATRASDTRTSNTSRYRASPSHADRPGYLSRAEARAVLGVGPDADSATIRRAYRERVKNAHPDTDGGSRAAFRRIQDSYNRLRDD